MKNGSSKTGEIRCLETIIVTNYCHSLCEMGRRRNAAIMHYNEEHYLREAAQASVKSRASYAGFECHRHALCNNQN